MLGRRPSRESGTEQETLRAFSRRDLLQMLAAAGAAMAAPAEAASRESTEGQAVRQEGVQKLFEAVRSKEDEQVSLFVRSGGEARWIDFGGSGIATYTPLPIERIQRELANPDAAVEIFHTHPLQTVLEAHGAPAAEAPAQPWPMPPSFQDVIESVQMPMLLGASADHLTQSVVDPTGVWTWRVDRRAPFVVELTTAIERIQKSLDGVPEGLVEEARKAVTKNSASDDPRLQAYALLQHIDELSPALQSRLRSATEPFLDLIGTRAGRGLLLYAEGVDMRGGSPTVNLVDYRDSRERDAAVAAYRRAGIELSYAPLSAS